MVVIREMLTRMESEHKTKLEQLHIMQEQQRYEVFRSVTVILFQKKKKKKSFYHLYECAVMSGVI